MHTKYLLLSIKLIKRSIPSRLHTTWNRILLLMIMILFSYSLSVLIFYNELFHMILMGAVYALGGLFVFVINLLTDKTVYALNENEEIKKLNKKIKEKSAFLLKVINSLNHPFYVIDANNYQIKLSNTASHFGSSGSTCYELTHKKDVPCGNNEHVCPLNEVKRTKKPVTVEHIHYDKNNGKRNVEIHAYPIFDENGDIVEMIEYSLDITERKRAEQKTLQLNKELTYAKQDLENLLEQKNEFIHILGHDLKNPLSAPMSLIPLLEQKLDDEKSLQILNVIAHSFDKIKAIIDDTLKLARLDSSDKSLMVENVNLYHIVEKSIKDLQEIISQYNFIVENTVSKELHVEADKFLLGQVLTNLISNAIKYTPKENEQRVIISSDCYNDSIVVSVKDFGRGIVKGHESLLFDKFSKDSKPRAGFDSTGLGLSICKGIIERHGGHIWVESEGPNKGATFSFSLPTKFHSIEKNHDMSNDLYQDVEEKVDFLLAR